MQFSTLFLAAAAATLASAVELTNPSFNVAAGSPFNITWANADGPVTLTLKDGPSTNLHTVTVIGSGLTGGSHTWTPPVSLDSGIYAIEISDSSSDPNYSVQFPIAAAAGSSISSSYSGTSSSTSETSSSTSGSSTASSTSGSSSSTSSSASASKASSHSSSSASKTSSSSPSASKTSSSASSSGSSTSTKAPTSAAVDLASPLALVFLAFAAIVTLN
ncbi:hypothetical protein NHQ30_003947 [Ciborinia camelliae]|nr:hypothetical protein NHQ30_003947 [Ciborinia camelliae]